MFLSVVAFTFCSCTIKHTEQSPSLVVFSKSIQDSFSIYVNKLPGNKATDSAYHFIYYLDATIKSGKKVRSFISENKSALSQSNFIFIGIGHYGDFHEKRRRDFIPYNFETKEIRNYGKAKEFYQFLADTIIPVVEKQFAVQMLDRSIIGHSFGGLFVTNMLFSGDSLFNNYYALSPSLWVDDYAIIDSIASNRHKFSKLKSLYFSAGNLENLNKVKTSCKRLNKLLDQNKFDSLRYTYSIINWANHNSQVNKSLQEIFIKY